MKTKTAVFLSAALVVLGGAGLILGNGVLASNAFAAGSSPEAAIVMPEAIPASALQFSDVGMYRDADGAIYIASANGVDKMQEEAAPQTAGEKNQLPDAAGRKMTSVVSGSAEYPFKEGAPLENELSSDEAQEVAVNAIVEKYALTQATLEKFKVTTKYFEIYSDEYDKHIWRVSLDPVNTDDFSEIGCYMALLNAETGEIFQITSAADGKG